ncbi:SAM and SH3 domain-containing protein 3, partial [Stegodyphus mimosarum]
MESIPSGSGSSLQPPTPTSSNRSSTSAGEDDHSPYVGTFIGRARALVDCTPSPYDRDGLAFKKGDIIDIIAKHKTGIWVGMCQGKVGHFKFINVQEIVEERKIRHRHRKVNSEWLNNSKKPDSLEEMLTQLGLQEYINVLVLNGYNELDTFKEIEKVDLDNLGITNPDHNSKLLRAAEMLQDGDPGEEIEGEESQLQQSPRDSGCYASHENLIHRDSSQRALSNGQFMVDLEDQDTSHSESGIHSREGQDSGLTMNNLDLSAESSTKSTATTMDDVAGVTDQNDCVDEINDLSNYNIPPTQENSYNNRENETISASLRNAVGTLISRPEEDVTTLSVPYLLSTSGTKSSPGSPRKTRNKHSRNKSHSHHSKDIYNDLNSQTFSFGKSRHISADMSSDRGSYVYGWASFSRNEKASRRNLHEYDDIVSDPATEAEDSPGRHIYRRVKQRKGSLQTLIHDTRPPSPTLISKVNKKLVVEKIYLHEEPYTDKTGFCGIPPALVQRYAEELQHNIVDVADALDQIRITSLQQQARRGVPNDFLSDSCIVPVIEPNYSSLRSWLISLGLPMYESHFTSAGLTELQHVATLGVEDLTHLGVRDPYHQIYLESALEVLYMRFRRRPQTYPQGPPSMS